MSVVRRSWVGGVVFRPETGHKFISKFSIIIDAKWQPIFTSIHSPSTFSWVGQWCLYIPALYVMRMRNRSLSQCLEQSSSKAYFLCWGTKYFLLFFVFKFRNCLEVILKRVKKYFALTRIWRFKALQLEAFLMTGSGLVSVSLKSPLPMKRGGEPHCGEECNAKNNMLKAEDATTALTRLVSCQIKDSRVRVCHINWWIIWRIQTSLITWETQKHIRYTKQHRLKEICLLQTSSSHQRHALLFY